MISATVLFQPGWKHQATAPGGINPATGNPQPGQKILHPGRGLLQEHLWSGFTELAHDSARDERLVLFEPQKGMPHEIDQEDSMIDPQGRHWNAITPGMPRGIPGKTPDYIAVRVRRAQEQDH